MKRYIKKLTSLVNLGFRSLSLVFRFLLSFYIIKYLGYEATGIYGLALGAIGIVPAAIGWGLNYFVAREVVGKDPAYAANVVHNRLFVTTVTLALVTILCVAIALAAGYSITLLYGIIIALIWLETYGLDIHLPLIGQDMATEANLLVFVRSALWVPFAAGLGIAFPVFRNLETVFIAWILSYGVAVALLLYLLRHWPLRQAFTAPIDYGWIRERLRHSWHIYVSDLALVGLIYTDRYIVSFMLGLTLTGIYTFFWSLTNALQTLMQTAVVQLALPVLFRAFKEGTPDHWSRAFRREMLKTMAFGTILGLGVFGASEILIRIMGMHELSQHRDLFILLLLAAIVRSFSDLLNIGLTSRNKDKHYATLNIIGVFLSIALAFAMIAAFGLIGAGIAAFTAALSMVLLKGYFLLHFARGTRSIDSGTDSR
ncbi:hypothetical protein BJF92_20730 [Rhizobium rhizosphaerae]|uniref:Polysaccharide biosynthesis protein n=1 Tax=Xaviernesmea rhizosphaerae TaxID=1672749 RepID=A0A1Q9ACW2_9HYPH|nr:oligosaccharide flippase family protein [Xaviernesmea rhizosphaerae]OLP52749.1 hypothetical protein BJF92_20730 [Xaviernesmea rhizosphaerae]